MRFLICAVWLLAGCSSRPRCYDCGAPMRQPEPFECGGGSDLTCYGESHDGCLTKQTTKHACVPTEVKVGASCGGEAISCGYGRVDACKFSLGDNHLCVVTPPWMDPATGRVAETARVKEDTISTLLDIDQPREQKPGGDWTQQQYIGPKQYDRLFVQLEHTAPSVEPPTGPLAEVDRVELLALDSPTPLATRARAELHYTAESIHEFETDVGEVSNTRERMKLSLGAAVGTYVKSSHPFELVIRGRTAGGVLVFQKVITGDEAGDYPTITPPRPY